MAQYGLRKDDGGGGAPVGLTVFKTAGVARRGPRWVRLPYASACFL